MQRTPLWPTTGMLHPVLGTKIISCPGMTCGQSRRGQNVPPCGHREPSSLPAHPGLTPPAGQNGPTVNHTESFSSPFFLPLLTARRCNSSHIFPPLPTACRRKGPSIVVPLPTAWRYTGAHVDFCLFPPHALATPHTYFHLFQRHSATASTV